MQTTVKLEKLSVEVLNTSGLEPCGYAVLVKPYEPEIQKSLIVIPDSVGDRTKMAETRAVVIAVGPTAWSEEKEPRAVPGDKVLISRYSGILVRGTLDDQYYRMINDRDIYCRIAKEKQA